jgi:hypothetical protein
VELSVDKVIWREKELTHERGAIYSYRYRWKNKFIKKYLTTAICCVCNGLTFAHLENWKRSHRAVCSRKCQNELISGPGNSNWKGEEKYKRGNSVSHVLKYTPNHPFSKKKFVPKHRLIIEESLKRFLDPKEVVHHIDNDPTNNEIENLVLCIDNKEHNKIHSSVFRCLPSLIKSSALIFNKNKKIYEVPNDLIYR